MATNRRKSHTRRDAVVTDGLWRYLAGDPDAMQEDIELRYFTDEDTIKQAWDANKAEILQQWITEHPGTRPVCWWKYDAPQEYEVEGTGIRFAMRKQLSGDHLI